jgi:hypothetical protein
MLKHKIISEAVDDLKGLALIVKNGIFITISESENMFGTTAIALPIKAMQGENISSILPVFGVRNDILAKSIAERLSQKTNKMVIASIYFKKTDGDILNKITQLIKKIMERL